MSATNTHTPVVTVGGGPAGLCLAIEFGMRGVACTLFDDKPDTTPHLQANATQARTMQTFRRNAQGLSAGVTGLTRIDRNPQGGAAVESGQDSQAKKRRRDMSAAALIFARRNLGRAAQLPWRLVLVAVALTCAGLTSAYAQTVDGYACTRESDQRTIEIRYANPSGLPCEVRYSTGPGRQSKWAARNTPGLCESIANRIRTNLQNGGFQCVALAGGEQPAGTVEARRELGEAEIVQASAALDKCLTKLRTMGAGCADQPFAFKVVGRAETPMAIGGADVPVFLVEARYGPGSRSHAQGLLYLVSQNDPQLRRLVDESYGDLRSARSADLNDDGRTEIMVFTSYSAGRGFGHTSFVVVGDARMLGYAVAQNAPVRVHEVYVLASRTSGYRDLMALAGDSVFECHYRFGYQCKQLLLLDTEGAP